MTAMAPELDRLDILRQFKQRMPREELGENISPFDDRVTTAQGNVGNYDLNEIHADIRRRIENIITAVHEGTQKSQVILIAGDAGTGKTHLLRMFQSPKLADHLGHVFVGGSNHWAVNEFQAQLLDWMIEALTLPSPNADHLLLDRIRVIGFRALEQLLASPVAWRECLVQPKRGLLSPLVRFFRSPSHEQLMSKVAKRDPRVFDQFDFTQFSAYVCDRFLVDRSNITHRYALRVLLTYLFSDPHEKGIGVRERVLHWFRGRAEGDYFHRRLGATEKLDRQFAQFEAVKLLIHLFSPAVSNELSTDDQPCPSKVFLLVFDQSEGRNELFDSKVDWKIFFAHLSELYNNLPNVIVLFTTTLKLRNELHSEMERQFKDRIHMDSRFQLKLPTSAQLLDLYRSRIEFWLRDDPPLLARYRELENHAEPFTPEKLTEIGGHESIRVALENFDRAFHNAMTITVIVDPVFDFLFNMNELRKEAESQNDFAYTTDHLETVRDLLNAGNPWIFAGYRFTVTTEEVIENEANALKLEIKDLANPQVWLRVYLVRVTFMNIQNQVEAASKILQDRRAARAKYTLWLVRANTINQWMPMYPDQTFHRVISPEIESTFRALTHVISKQGAYQEVNLWEKAQLLVRKQFAQTYLAELFADARKRLDGFLARQNKAEPPEESE